MDIGTLTGQIAIEDQLTDHLTEIANHVKHFADEFEGAMGAMAIGVGVAAAAIIGLTISVVALGEEGSKIIGVENAFDRLAESAGTTGDALRGGLLAGIKGTIDDMQAMQSTTRLLGSGMQLTADQANLMGRAARELGKATGTDAAGGLNILSGALTTGRTRQLQMQGIIVDTAAGEKKFADSIGTTVEQLNAAGKLEGKRIAILDATKTYVDRLGESQLSFAEKIKQGEVAFDDWLDELRKGVASSADVNAALDAIGAAVSAAFGADKQGITEALLGGINAFARGVTAVVPYVVDFAHGVKDAYDFSMQFWPVIKLAAEVFIAYQGALLLAEAGTWLFTVATTAANAISVTYTATTGLMSGGVTAVSGALGTATLSVNTFALAVGALVVGYKLGSWLEENVAWVRKLSDGVQFVSLIFQGFSSTAAASMVATSHVTEESIKADKATSDWAASITTTVEGSKILSDQEKDTAAAIDKHKFTTDKLTESQKKYNEALLEYNSKTGADYLVVMDKIGVAMYEGIAADHARGVGAETLAQIYKTSKFVIEDVIGAEKKWAELKKETAAVHKIETENLFGLEKAIGAVDDRELKLLKTQLALNEAMKMVEKSIPPVVDGFKSVVLNLENVGTKSDEIDKIKLGFQIADEETKKFNATLTGQLLTTLKSIPQIFSNAFSGGGGVLGAIGALGSQIAGDFMSAFEKKLSAVAPKIKAALSASVGAGVAGTSILGNVAGLNNTTNTIIATGTALAGAAISATAATVGIAGFAAGSVGATVAAGAMTLGIGAAAVGVALLIKHFTGLSADVKQARADVIKFQDAMGGVQGTINTVGEAFARLGLSGDQAQAALKAMWNTDAGAAAVDKAIGDITDKIQRAAFVTNILDGDFTNALNAGLAMGAKLPPALQASLQKLDDMGVLTNNAKSAFDALTGSTGVSFKSMSDIASKYGNDLTSLGPKFEAAKISDTAAGIINDFDTLQRGLDDTDEALRIMRKPINDLVNDSLQFGTAIPANMQPWVDQLEKTNQLTDTNGNLLTDLSGLKFADPIKTQFQILIDKISELVDKISGSNGLTASLNNIPSKVTTEVETVHTDVYNSVLPGDQAYAAMGGRVTATGISYFATGTDNVLTPNFTPQGTDVVPAMLTPGESVQSVSDTNSTAVNIKSLAEQQRTMAATLKMIAIRDREFPRTLTRVMRDVMAS
ncbi:MAG: hypothetical protein V4529_17165 [Gemmatimonadota bacterium]